MLDQIVLISGISPEILEQEIKVVHEANVTSEYAFVIEELHSLKSKHPGKDLTAIYQPAIAAFRESRNAELALYPSVLKTLQAIKSLRCLVIGYTESLDFYSTYRVRKLALDGLLDFLYFPPDH